MSAPYFDEVAKEIDSAKNKIEILSREIKNLEKTIIHLQWWVDSQKTLSEK